MPSSRSSPSSGVAGPRPFARSLPELSKRKRTGYTTVLKLLQIMAAKGLVTRDERERSHIYAATAGEAKTQRRLLRDLLERAFGGSRQKLLLGALDATRATPAELDALRALLDDDAK